MLSADAHTLAGGAYLELASHLVIVQVDHRGVSPAVILEDSRERVNMGHKTSPPHSHPLTLITPIEPNNSDSLSVLTSSGRPVTYTASSRCFFSIGPAREGGKTSVTTHPLLPYEDYEITGSYVIYSPSISMLPVVIVIRYKG